MSLRDIQCTCPDCGAEFSLERAIGEQALAGVLDEINASSDEKIREKVKTDWWTYGYDIVKNNISDKIVTVGCETLKRCPFA